MMPMVHPGICHERRALSVSQLGYQCALCGAVQRLHCANPLELNRMRVA